MTTIEHLEMQKTWIEYRIAEKEEEIKKLDKEYKNYKRIWNDIERWIKGDTATRQYLDNVANKIAPAKKRLVRACIQKNKLKRQIVSIIVRIKELKIEEVLKCN